MPADPRWLEILKASGGQSLALAAACAGLMAAHFNQIIPALDPWMIQAATFLGILGGMLWVVSVCSAFYKFYPIDGWAMYFIRQRRAKRDAEKYIPFMSVTEREIIAYLLATNEKTFTAASDGGKAVTLISRGIVLRHLTSGQIFLQNDMPFSIPDNIWKVLVKHKDKFPISQVDIAGPYPWRDQLW